MATDKQDRLRRNAEWLNAHPELTRSEQAAALGITSSGLYQLLLRIKAEGLTVADSRGVVGKATIPGEV